jgi:hypothetical protein
MIEPNIWGAFQEAWFEIGTNTEPYHIVFREEKCRNTREFQEIWLGGLPLENLSTRRQNARFGWINHHE